MGVTVDTSSFDRGIKDFEMGFEMANKKGLEMVANEVLRLSSFEVPHDTGMLQASGSVQPRHILMTTPEKGFLVGYNKVYAARLHEHPEYKFQKGRKGKYLEDPIKNNLHVFRDFLARGLRGAFR